ncbi:hypothetical protein BDF22DRAFT_769858 [Syncephalis plumigaleata]|nr:hypothetical protein BDF22DRAFT_769858 [Syncephalis plumigaleata]
MQMVNSSSLLLLPPPTPLPVHRSTSMSALSESEANYPSSRSRSSSIASAPIMPGSLNFVPSSASSQAHHLIGSQDGPLAEHVARLAARCDELEWIQQSLQRENDRWRQEVDTLRAERIRIEQELRETETRLATLRPVTPIGIDQESMPLSPIRCAQMSFEEQAEKQFNSDEEHTDSNGYLPESSTLTYSVPGMMNNNGTNGGFAQPEEPKTSHSLMEQLRNDLQKTSEKLAAETRRRGELETAKANIEAQLEDLSRTVFEEAQKMVVDERRARAEAERKRDIYHARVQELQDVEQMLKAQLNDLKRMMEKAMSAASVMPTTTTDNNSSVTNESTNEFGSATTNIAIKLDEGNDTDNDANHQETTIVPKSTANTVRHVAHGSVTSLNSFPSADSAYGSDMTSPTASGFAADPIAVLLAFETAGRRYTDFVDFYRMCSREANVLNIGYTNGVSNKALVETASLAVDPVTTSNSKFLRRCQNDDVEPCVRFDRAGYFLQRKLHTGVQSGTLIIEPVAASDARQLFAYQTMITSPGSTFQPPCTLCERPCPPESSHRLFLEGERDSSRQSDTQSQSQRLICADCRLRLVAACEFWAYVRLMRRGLIRATPEQIYHDLLRHRMRMFLARVGAHGAATLPVHGAHTVAQPVGANAASAGHSSLPGAINDGCTKRKSAPNLSSCVAAKAIATKDGTGSMPSSPHVSPTKLVGGGRDPELAETTSNDNNGNNGNGNGINRNPWRSSMVDAMAGARRSWATLSQLSF